MPRQQTTEAVSLEALEELAGLPELTEKQYGYVRGRLQGKSNVEALRASIDCSDWTPNAQWVEASKLEHNPKVRLWLARMKAKVDGELGYTLNEHISELDALKEISVRSGNMGAAVNASVNKGKAAGHYVTQIDVRHHTSPQEALPNLLTVIEELAKIPAFKTAMLEKLGVQALEEQKVENEV